MREAFRQTCLEESHLRPLEYREGSAEAAEQRLDDARIDMYVAMVEGEPAGKCALFQVGDIGRIVDLYVGRAHRRQRVGTALLHHVIALAKRLLARLVCLEVPTAASGTIAFLKTLGFVDCGRTIAYLRPGTFQPDYEIW
jgi:GNAT superfamily N-acetyltransferase